METHKGAVLVSEPFLKDPNFHRTVVIIAEHTAEGTIGFVLNHQTVLNVNDLFDDFECNEHVYLGGPVAKNTFHYIHTIASLQGALQIMPGLYWGGDFEMLKFYFQEGLTDKDQIRFFAGYSGWGAEQLADEIEEKSWIVAEGKPEYIFSDDKELWKHVLGGLGGEFRWLSKAPEDVSLN